MDGQTTGNNAGASGPVAVGQVLSVRGSEAQVGLPVPWPAEQLRATVGKYLAIETGTHALVGLVTEVTARQPNSPQLLEDRAIARVDLMGEISRDASGRASFRRGVTEYPAIGDAAVLLAAESLRLIYARTRPGTIEVGSLSHDRSISATLDVDNLISKHFAVLGSTGVGKSSGLAVMLNEIINSKSDLRIFLLDGHNEYGRSFGEKALVIGPHDLRLPFWLFNFDEFTDVLYGGRPGIQEELDILAELIPIAKTAYLSSRASGERLGLKKLDPKRTGYTVDTPVPYLLQDLIGLIDDRMGKLENRSSRMNYHRLTVRIETLRNDPRYAFMFENASVGGDTMAALLTHLFRLEPNGQPVTVMQMAGLPVEVVDAVVCVLCRLAFDFGLWSDGTMPLLFVCEEAHRYAAADHTVGFAPTRRALSRMAKEGRKYGVFLGLASQRPAELDPTVLSQCSTLFAMRMANDLDPALLRSAVTDAAAHLLDFVPTLGTGEVVAFGEGVPIPTRFVFRTLDQALLPRSEAADLGSHTGDRLPRDEFIKAVVERWRGSMISGSIGDTEGSWDGRPGADTDAQPEVQRLLDRARMQLLKSQ